MRATAHVFEHQVHFAGTLYNNVPLSVKYCSFFHVFKELQSASAACERATPSVLANFRQNQTMTGSRCTGSKFFPRLTTRGATFSAGPMSIRRT